MDTDRPDPAAGVVWTPPWRQVAGGTLPMPEVIDEVVR